MTQALTYAGYVVVVAAIVAREIVARQRGTATFGDAVTALVRTRLGKWLVIAGWLWVGWHVFVRVDHG